MAELSEEELNKLIGDIGAEGKDEETKKEGEKEGETKETSET